ncbi:uncharacterized protein LOC5508792 [Nematostella vectensis]|uniref:uncharacterized protein LOC5508792 n=1 Tax=Nematostella vectensis TaxID=45351 RepID=UPI00138FF797|nr:uncharacterized protein LOC5508792 [Nematostella vectensis]
MLDQHISSPKSKKFACGYTNGRTFSPFCVPPLHRLSPNTRIFQPEEMSCRIILPPSLLTHLSEEVLVVILEYLDFKTLITLSKTCRLFHRLCLSDLIWRHRCKADFDLVTRWPEYSYIYLYEMFYKAEVLKNDHNFFRPVSQLKTSVIVWYLLNSEPPSHSVSHLTPSQAKSIWGLTDECLESHYEETQQDRDDNQEADYPSSYYEWSSLYKIFVKKHGGIVPMQNYVLKRCLRNRQALEEHYQLSLHSSRQQKWYQYLEDREMGNHKALKALTEHMRPTTHNYMLHQITTKYIDGRLKGGFRTVKAYAEFCGYFKNWLDAKSVKLWPPRQGEMVAQDYRHCLKYVNRELTPLSEEVELTVNDFLSKAKPYIERLHEVWLWQNRRETAYRKEHRPSAVVREHRYCKDFLENGNLESFTKLKLYFERKEIVVAWFKENGWMHPLLGDYVVRPLRPACISSADLPTPHYNTGCIQSLVQRFLETGLRSDFNKIRKKLSDMAGIQLQNLVRKSRQLQESIQQDVMKEDCVYVSEFEDRSFMNFFGSSFDSFTDFSPRAEVVILD